MTVNPWPFDRDEAFALARHALQSQRPEVALSLTRQALAQAPDDADLLYLQALVHAQIGLDGRAIDGLTQALQRAPAMAAARFQLGLILFGRGQVEPAAAAWAPLQTQLAADEPVRQFADGLTRLGRLDLPGAIVALEQGLAHCRHPALAADMQPFLAQARAQLAQAEGAAAAAADARTGASANADAARHLLLSGYGRSG